MPHHVQTVVKGQHEEVSAQVSDVIPHDMLLQARGRRNAGLIDDSTQSPDDFPGNKSDVGGRQGHCRLGHDFCLSGSQAAGNGPFDETVEDHVNQFTHLFVLEKKGNTFVDKYSIG